MSLFIIEMDSYKDLTTNVKERLDQEPTTNLNILFNP